jgi:hypothetical protein
MTDARDPAASFDAEIACHTRWKTSERTNAENPSIVRRHDGIAAAGYDPIPERRR